MRIAGRRITTAALAISLSAGAMTLVAEQAQAAETINCITHEPFQRIRGADQNITYRTSLVIDRNWYCTLNNRRKVKIVLSGVSTDSACRQALTGKWDYVPYYRWGDPEPTVVYCDNSQIVPVSGGGGWK